MLRVFKIWMLLMPAVVLMLTACINDDFQEDGTVTNGEEPVGDVFIRFRLSLGEGTGSRADGETAPGTGNPDYLTPGTANEQAISSIDILVCDASDNLIDIMYLTPKQIAEASAEGTVVPLIGVKGKKLHIYAAVNLSPSMRGKFTYGQRVTDVSFASSGADSWDVMNEFIPGSYGKSDNLGVSGIPMTGQFVLEGSGSADIEINQPNTSTSALKVKADLRRIVAKVHLLARTQTFKVNNQKTDSVTYVIALDDPEKEGWLGWMRLDNVRYLINGTNRSTFIFPHTNEAGKGKDLNMSLAAYLSGNVIDKDKWSKDFKFYDGVSLHSANVSKTGYFGNAESFYDSKLANTSTSLYQGDNRYTKGLYCLENYFDIPADEAFYSGQKNAVPMVTHLSIATKLTPRRLAVLTDFPAKLQQFFDAAKEANFSEEFFRENNYNVTEADLNQEDIDLWEGTEEKKGLREIFGDAWKKEYVDKIPDNYGQKTAPNDDQKTELVNNDFYVFGTQTEDDAMHFVNWSLIMRKLWSGDDSFENGRYPKDTYFVYDTEYDKQYGGASGASTTDDGKWDHRYVYLVAGAVMNAKGDNISVKLHSVPHVGGWGYYYTYIDNNNGSGTVDGVTTFKASQVTRNSYYIITVENFGTPGGTITDPEYIKVNTDPVKWDYVGRGDIDLH